MNLSLRFLGTAIKTATTTTTATAKTRDEKRDCAAWSYYAGNKVGQAFQPDMAGVRLESLTYVFFLRAGVIPIPERRARLTWTLC